MLNYLPSSASEGAHTAFFVRLATDVGYKGFGPSWRQVVWHAAQNLFSARTLAAQALDLDVGGVNSLLRTVPRRQAAGIDLNATLMNPDIHRQLPVLAAPQSPRTERVPPSAYWGVGGLLAP